MKRDAKLEDRDKIRRRKNPDFRAFVRIAILTAIASVCILVITLIAAFSPFYTFLPALKIAAREAGTLRVHFLSIGQGDAAIVEFPDGACLLIDGGDGDFDNDTHLYRYLKGLEMTSLSVAITHADGDHYGGVASVLEKFPVDKLYLPLVSSGAKEYRDILDLVSKLSLETEVLTRYDVIENASGAYVACVSPRSAEDKTDNDVSTVLYLRYGTTSVLFAADISSVRERFLLREYALDQTLFDYGEYTVRLEETDILKVSHHGSRESSCNEWLSLLSPELSVISCGRGNDYGHPKEEAVARLANYSDKVLRTDELGDIIITIRETAYTVFY